MPLAVALFSGGLDSMLAVRVIQRENFRVHALYVQTLFQCCRTSAAQAAAELGVSLTVLPVDDEDYLERIRRPVYGYGKAVNPCVDCRISMFRVGRRLADELGARLVVSGEILGQRPMSQKRLDLAVIARDSGLEGRLLRPLSARLLPPTDAEGEGLVNRERLYAMHGRSRKPLLALAAELGIAARNFSSSAGCALAQRSFAPRLRDLLEHSPRAGRWEFELLRVGRHARLDAETKLVLGRSAEENGAIEAFFARADDAPCALVGPCGFNGPQALVVGPVSQASLDLAGTVVLYCARQSGPGKVSMRSASERSPRELAIGPPPATLPVTWL
jgi:tRNA-uridine 2-sulfurtransferase